MSPGGIPPRLCSTATKRYFVGGHPPSAVDQMILEGVEGILILSDDH
jgi:hypothetical protein